MSATDFVIEPGRGLRDAISLKERFRVVAVAPVSPEAGATEGVPLRLSGQKLGENMLDSLDYVDHGAAIYKGRRPRDECEATIKVFSLTGRLGDEHKALAARIEGAPKIRHPNLERLYETGRAGANFYASLERLEGESLEEKVERDGALPPAMALDILAAGANALSALHARGHIHGDVNPANVLLGPKGLIKVTGLGQTRETEDSFSLGGEVLGNIQYLAPERIDGRLEDPASDIYALGHTFYYALTGRAPFAGNSPIATLICHLKQHPPELLRMAGGLSADLDTLFRKMTAKKLENRYQDVNDLLNDLERVRAEAGLEAFSEPEDAAPIAVRVAKTTLIGALFLVTLMLAAHIYLIYTVVEPESPELFGEHIIPVAPLPPP